MLEKNGSLQLTPEERDLYTAGVVPPRVVSDWGITSIEDLRQFLATSQGRQPPNSQPPLDPLQPHQGNTP